MRGKTVGCTSIPISTTEMLCSRASLLVAHYFKIVFPKNKIKIWSKIIQVFVSNFLSEVLKACELLSQIQAQLTSTSRLLEQIAWIIDTTTDTA